MAVLVKVYGGYDCGDVEKVVYPQRAQSGGRRYLWRKKAAAYRKWRANHPEPPRKPRTMEWKKWSPEFSTPSSSTTPETTTGTS